MSKKNEATKDRIVYELKHHGFKEDRFGNWVREYPPQSGESTPHIVRFKFTGISVRCEVKTSHDEWVRTASGYLRDVRVNVLGEIEGLKANGCQSKRAF